MSGQFILDESGEPVACADLRRWADWIQTADRHVLDETLEDGTRVSTIFLGLDHQYGNGPPILWETCVFRAGGDSDVRARYASRREALAGHVDAVAAELARIGARS